MIAFQPSKQMHALADLSSGYLKVKTGYTEPPVMPIYKTY